MGGRGRRVIVQGHPQLLSKLRVILSDMRYYLTKGENEGKKKEKGKEGE